MATRREELELLRKKKRFQELQQRKQASADPGQEQLDALLARFERMGSTVEAGATIASSAFAEPVSGAVGLLDAATNLSAEKGAERVGELKDELTFRTEGGDKALQQFGGFLQSLGDLPGIDKLIEGATSFKDFATKAFETTGRAIGGEQGEAIFGSIGQAAPAAALELAGIKGLGAVDDVAIQAFKAAPKVANKIKAVKEISGNTEKILKLAAPTTEELKDAAQVIYQQIDDIGVSVKPEAVSQFAGRAAEALRKAGFDAQSDPLVSRALDRISEIDGPINTGEITILRKLAQKATQSATPSEARLGRILTNEFDDFLTNLNPSQTVGGDVKGLGTLYKKAGELWKRSIKTDAIGDLFDKAELKVEADDVGFKRAIVSEFKTIINRNKKTKQFTDDEISDMKKVVKSGSAGSMLSFIGRLDLTQQQKANALVGVSTFGAGVAVGGPLGFAVPGIGFVSRALADKLTRGKADFAQAIVAAGSDGREIVRQYLKRVPLEQRDSAELTQLLINRGADLGTIKSTAPLVQEAIGNAKNFSPDELAIAFGLATPSELPQQEEQ